VMDIHAVNESDIKTAFPEVSGKREEPQGL